MILLALALAQAATPAEAQAAEVTVIGRRLKGWRANWHVHDGRAVCRTTRSTGDPEIDAIGCAAIDTCAVPMTARVIALAKDKTLDREARKRATDALDADLGRCVVARRDVLITELADRRATARHGS